jgi:hypothetical protein
MCNIFFEEEGYDMSESRRAGFKKPQFACMPFIAVENEDSPFYSFDPVQCGFSSELKYLVNQLKLHRKEVVEEEISASSSRFSVDLSLNIPVHQVWTVCRCIDKNISIHSHIFFPLID